MNVFVSWSGSLSHKIALKLREWLPLVVAPVKVYVSSEDIDKGVRWAPSVGEELETATFGIICVTLENQAEPWVQFEAGALSRRLDRDRVSPLLIDLRPAQIEPRNPLLQFQATEFTRPDLWKLTQSINRALETPQSAVVVEMQFGVWWPDLAKAHETGVKEYLKMCSRTPAAEPVSRVEQMLEEVLTLTRAQQRRMVARAPESSTRRKLVNKRWLLNQLKEFVVYSDQSTALSLEAQAVERKRLLRILQDLDGTVQNESDRHLINRARILIADVFGMPLELPHQAKKNERFVDAPKVSTPVNGPRKPRRAD